MIRMLSVAAIISHIVSPNSHLLNIIVVTVAGPWRIFSMDCFNGEIFQRRNIKKTGIKRRYMFGKFRLFS